MKLRSRCISMVRKLEQLRASYFTAVCGVIAGSALLCGCDSRAGLDGDYDPPASRNAGGDKVDRGRNAEPIVINAGNARTYYNRSVAHLKGRRYTDAIAACGKAIAFEPNHARAHLNTGIAHARLKQHALACSTFPRSYAVCRWLSFGICRMGRTAGCAGGRLLCRRGCPLRPEALASFGRGQLCRGGWL